MSNFAVYFNKCCSPNSVERGDTIYSWPKYANLRKNYCGLPCTDEQVADAALVDKIIRSLNGGKAAGLESLTAEHLKYCHLALATISAKPFLTSRLCWLYTVCIWSQLHRPITEGWPCNRKISDRENFRVYLSALCCQHFNVVYLSLQPATTNFALKGGLAAPTLYTPSEWLLMEASRMALLAATVRLIFQKR